MPGCLHLKYTCIYSAKCFVLPLVIRNTSTERGLLRKMGALTKVHYFAQFISICSICLLCHLIVYLVKHYGESSSGRAGKSSKPASEPSFSDAGDTKRYIYTNVYIYTQNAQIYIYKYIYTNILHKYIYIISLKKPNPPQLVPNLCSYLTPDFTKSELSQKKVI